MAKLSSSERKSLPASDFAYPATREYPIEDRGHAEMALAMASKSHDQAVMEHVAAAVRKHFPGMEVRDQH